MTPITRELLKDNGYSRQEPYFNEDVIEYADKSGRIIFAECSNMVGREWTIHVDNEDMESIGSLDVQYVEQANALLDLLDMQEFKLKVPNNQKEYYGG